MALYLGISIAVAFMIGSSVTLTSENEPAATSKTKEKDKNVTADMLVDYIIHKYTTEDNVLSFEGYEHLLENLELGMIREEHSYTTHLHEHRTHDHGSHSKGGDHNGHNNHGDNNDHTHHDHSNHNAKNNHGGLSDNDEHKHQSEHTDHKNNYQDEPSNHSGHDDHDHSDHDVPSNNSDRDNHDHSGHDEPSKHNDHTDHDHHDHSDQEELSNHNDHTDHDHHDLTGHDEPNMHSSHTDHDHSDPNESRDQSKHTDHDHYEFGDHDEHSNHSVHNNHDLRVNDAHPNDDRDSLDPSVRDDHSNQNDYESHGHHDQSDNSDDDDHLNHADLDDHSDYNHGSHGDHDDLGDHSDHNHGSHGDQDDLVDHSSHGDQLDQSGRLRNKRRLKKDLGDSRDIGRKCLRPREILRLMRFSDNGLTKKQFIELCPLLIIQLDGHACHLHDHQHPDLHVHGEAEIKVNSKTWLYACGSIVVISLSGLICVGILSLLHHMFVENFLHFLVAMAVGALTGDAMLHLLPHSLSSADGHVHDHSDGEGHDMEGVYKGLAGLSIFYFFFLFGRIQDIARIKKIKKRKQMTEDLESVDITMVIRAPDEEGNMIMDKIVTVKKKEDDEKEHFGHSHGHSHSHGHDDLPTSTGAMVWRVLVGDGIHNFTDGLAIGVAFADSVTSGLSTAIAVLCHELPHEIGDFAVLLKKGMSIKRALGFNCLSSALSMIGVLAGVAMGNITDIKFYILLCVAGMFIYISLVDMLPEISSSPTKNPLRHLVFTMTGICVGSGIMLAIALKEDELAKIIT